MDRPKRGVRGKWWVVRQHSDITVVEAAERPSTEVGKGERGKKIRGPYATKDEASKVAGELESRTLKFQAGR